jgi:hypothetical protein
VKSDVTMKSVKIIMMIAALLGLIFVAYTVVAESGVETDPQDDVIVFETNEQGEENQYETDELPSADIVEVSYDRVDGGTEVTVMFQVNPDGVVEETLDIYNLNESEYLNYFSDPVPLAYMVILTTDQAEYSVEYIFGNCTMNYEDTVDYTIDDDVFTATFDLQASNETITSIGAQSMFMELSITSGTSKFYMDAAPDTFLFMTEIDAPSAAKTGEQIEFTGLTTNLADILGMGLSDIEYTYEWDFDDGSTGTGETVTHTYQYPGTYTVELTVSDSEGTETTDTHQITIAQGSSSNGDNTNNNGNDNNDDEGSPVIIFIAIIALIVVIGVIALVVVIRR